MKICQNYNLAGHTTFKIGSFAELVYIPESKEEFVALLQEFAAKNQMPLIIGNGSNLLVSSSGVSEPVILTSNLDNMSIEGAFLKAECGTKTGYAARMALEKGLSGLEFLHVIPASVGGVLKMNASAHSQSIKDVIVEAEVFDYEDCEVKTLSKDVMELAYRSSIFQKKRLILLEALFKLVPRDKKLIKQKMDENLAYRKEKQPSLLEPNAGSIFRNPDGAVVGKMIDELGMKGLCAGGAKISDLHGNFIVNSSKQATSEDVSQLMFEMYSAVEREYGYKIRPEIIFVGNKTKKEEKIWEILKGH